MTFSIGQLENDEASRFEITTVSNGQTIRNIINLNATNTSATPTLAEIRGLQALSGPEAVLADDLRPANVALELEYLANFVVWSTPLYIQTFPLQFVKGTGTAIPGQRAQ